MAALNSEQALLHQALDFPVDLVNPQVVFAHPPEARHLAVAEDYPAFPPVHFLIELLPHPLPQPEAQDRSACHRQCFSWGQYPVPSWKIRRDLSSHLRIYCRREDIPKPPMRLLGAKWTLRGACSWRQKGFAVVLHLSCHGRFHRSLSPRILEISTFPETSDLIGDASTECDCT